jgi:hypothetical protein
MTTEEKLAHAEALLVELKRLVTPHPDDSNMFEEDSSLRYDAFRDVQRLLTPTSGSREVYLTRAELVSAMISACDSTEDAGGETVSLRGWAQLMEKVKRLKLALKREREGTAP